MRAAGNARGLEPPRAGDDAVCICLCNALADIRIKEALANGAARPRDVYAACGCRAQCGGCTKAVLRLIREARAPASGCRSVEVAAPCALRAEA